MASVIAVILTASTFALSNQAFAVLSSASTPPACPPGCIPLFPSGCACFGASGLTLSAGGGTTSIKVGASGLALSAGGASVTFQGGGPHASTGGVRVPVIAIPPISLNTR
jgi:hypothetical protein